MAGVLVLVLLFLGFVFFGAVSGYLANSRIRELTSQLDRLRKLVRQMRDQAAMTGKVETPAEKTPQPTPAPPAPPQPAVPPGEEPAPAPTILPSPAQARVEPSVHTPSPKEKAASLVAALSPPEPESESPAPEEAPLPATSQAKIDAVTFQRPAWVEKLVAFFHRPDWVAAFERNVGQRWMT